MSDILPWGSDDPRYFTVTSDKPYDRHHYTVVFKDGRELLCESWEQAYSIWFDKHGLRTIDRIDVKDIKKAKVRKPKPSGF